MNGIRNFEMILSAEKSCFISSIFCQGIDEQVRKIVEENSILSSQYRMKSLYEIIILLYVLVKPFSIPYSSLSVDADCKFFIHDIRLKT